MFCFWVTTDDDSYLWAEVLSADAFAAFEEAGALEAVDGDGVSARETLHALGRRFRDTVLARGGGQDPTEVFVDFRGKEPTPNALLRSRGIVVE